MPYTGFWVVNANPTRAGRTCRRLRAIATCRTASPISPFPEEQRDGSLLGSDQDAAWDRANGRCVACGTPTIREARYQHVRHTLRDRPDLFDLTPTHIQRNGKEATLWRDPVLLMVKGVADHVTPRAHGGPTGPTNLANTCGPCNYVRNSTTLDDLYCPTYGPH
jgi:hypothetical protein